MSLTIRLEAELEEFIELESRLEGITKSDVVRNCIREFYLKSINKRSA